MGSIWSDVVSEGKDDISITSWRGGEDIRFVMKVARGTNGKIVECEVDSMCNERDIKPKKEKNDSSNTK